MPQWTPEQDEVIKCRDCNVLVSAGAGSGKTSVLVARIISIITDSQHPVDVDSLIIVTFTKAAAAEMKARIGAAIIKALKDDPDNLHLQRQQTLLHNAKITTIDSFCLDIVRNFFHKIDLSPDFRIADEAELKLLKEDVLDDMLEDMYAEADPGFLKIVECFTPGKSDESLKRIISDMHTYSMSYSDSHGWIRRSTAYYKCDEGVSVDDNPAVKASFEYARIIINELISKYDYLEKLASEANLADKWQEIAANEKAVMESLGECENYSELYRELEGFSFARLSGKHPETVDEEKIDIYKILRDEIRSRIKDLKTKIISFSPEEIITTLISCEKDMNTIADMVIRFDVEYSAAKRERKIVDFNDVEHFALKILTNEDGSRSDIAKQYAASVHEIFIDEYQDSNGVQDDILRAVSGIEEGRNNIFMVGDVKQSIYRFRMAKPELFMEKYDTYTLEPGPERLIDLHNNFRSRREVIESVNFIFRQLMHTCVGKVEYDKAAELVMGAKYYPDWGIGHENDTEFLILTAGEEGSLSGYNKRFTECVMVATGIKRMVESGEFLVTEGETMRPVRYGDIAILLRSAKDWKDIMASALEEAGIPLKESSTTGYFNAPEVLLTLSLLEIIDNPMQDIPLAAVLKSPIGNFSSRELALIRAQNPRGSFYRAVSECMKLTEDPEMGDIAKRLKTFFEEIEEFRRQAVYLPVNELIELVVTKTGYLEMVSAMPGGATRRENILMLMERAVGFEKTSFKGLFNFLRYIARMKKYEIDFAEPESAPTDEDKVSIMTIHKSKGLEFPVVFLCGTSKSFNKSDNRAPVVLHSDMGAGIDYIDPDRRIKYPTIAKNILSARLEMENLGEELRVLYVALTRAKEKLIITGYIDDVDDKRRKMGYIGQRQTQALGFSDIMSAGSFSDWIFMSCMKEDCDCLKIECLTADQVMEEWDQMRIMENVTRQAAMITVDPEPEEYFDLIKERFSYAYPYPAEVNLKTKMSVSELKKRAYLSHHSDEEEEPETNIYNEDVVIPYVPDFVEKKEEHAGIRRGNAYHAIMEHFDYKCPDMWKSFEDQLSRMVSSGYLRPEDKEIVFRKSFKAFFDSKLAGRMKAAAEEGKLYREKPFVMGIPAKTVVSEVTTDELVVVQGIIDAYFIEDGQVILVDYKTDKVDSESELIDRYRAQLDLYEEAVIKFSGLPVKEKIIYSFCLDREIVL